MSLWTTTLWEMSPQPKYVYSYNIIFYFFLYKLRICTNRYMYIRRSVMNFYFLAGDLLRSKARYKALDETGVVGKVCRHEFPYRLYNIHHGERYTVNIHNYLMF